MRARIDDDSASSPQLTAQYHHRCSPITMCQATKPVEVVSQSIVVPGAAASRPPISSSSSSVPVSYSALWCGCGCEWDASRNYTVIAQLHLQFCVMIDPKRCHAYAHQSPRSSNGRCYNERGISISCCNMTRSNHVTLLYPMSRKGDFVSWLILVASLP